MGLFEQFPYTNFHEMNTAWIVEKVKECLANVENIQNGLNTTNKNLAELKEYVLNYFANLDLQDEVNKKLDEMAASGQLEQIIEKYLEVNTAKIYDTYTDMMNNFSSMVVGSVCRTLGYSALGDGGGAFYRVVELGGEYSANDPGIYKPQPGNKGLFLCADTPINVKQFGWTVYGRNYHHDFFDIAIKYALKNGIPSIYIPAGEYQIYNPIEIDTDGTNDICIIADANAHISTSRESLANMVVVAANAQNSTETRNYEKRVSISGGVWDGTNVTESVFKVYAYYRLFELKNARICNVKTVGIKNLLNAGDSASTRPGNMSITDVDIIGADWFTYDSTGILCENTTDNQFTRMVIDNVRKAYYSTAGGGDQLSQIHATLLTPKSLNKTTLGADEAEIYNQTIGFWSQSGSFMSNCYSDSFSIGFHNTYNGSMSNCEYYSFYKYTSTDLIVKYLVTNAYNAALTANGCKFRAPTGCTVKVVELENVSSYTIGETLYNRGRSPLDIEVVGGTDVSVYDIGRFSNYNTNGGRPKTCLLTTQTSGKYNRIGLVALWKVAGKLKMTLPNGYAEIFIDASTDTPTITVTEKHMRQAATLVFHPVTVDKWVESSKLYEIYYYCTNTGQTLRSSAIDTDSYFSIAATCGNSAFATNILDSAPDGITVELST